MLFVYPAIFHKEDDTYWVEFPDLEGCHTYGSSVNETMEAAQEALAAYLLTLLEQEKALTTPSDISAIHTLSEQGATEGNEKQYLPQTALEPVHGCFAPGMLHFVNGQGEQLTDCCIIGRLRHVPCQSGCSLAAI